jgi:hypothetical protein
MKLITSLYILLSLLPSGDNAPPPVDYFEYFTDRIAAVETGRTHWKNRSVITNFRGCIGENQIHPVTADFINDKYDCALNPAILEDNRTLRDLYIMWMRARGMNWIEAINGYNCGLD